jgi:putative nucleotidyltransferase with HDIG domain
MPNKRLYDEIGRHLTDDGKPSDFLNGILNDASAAEYPFNMLAALRKTGQSPVYHPEGNVWNHTMLVVDRAAEIRNRSSDTVVFMWAALLHDIGKPGTTRLRKGRITSYDHDRLGADLARKFLAAFTDDNAFIDKVTGLVRWHMQILFAIKDARFRKFDEMDKQADIREIALLGLCDRLGRVNADAEGEKENVRRFLRICSSELNKNIEIEDI